MIFVRKKIFYVSKMFFEILKPVTSSCFIVIEIFYVDKGMSVVKKLAIYL